LREKRAGGAINETKKKNLVQLAVTDHLKDLLDDLKDRTGWLNEKLVTPAKLEQHLWVFGPPVAPVVIGDVFRFLLLTILRQPQRPRTVRLIRPTCARRCLFEKGPRDPARGQRPCSKCGFTSGW
jgi:hypothetical protein